MHNSKLLNLILADIRVINTHRPELLPDNDADILLRIIRKHLSDSEHDEVGIPNPITKQFLEHFFDYDGEAAIRDAVQEVREALIKEIIILSAVKELKESTRFSTVGLNAVHTKLNNIFK